MRTSRAILALALLVASAAVVSAVDSSVTVKADFNKGYASVGTNPSDDGYSGACTCCTSSRLPITAPPAFHTCTFPSIANRPRVFPSLGSVEIIPSRAGEGVSRALPRRSLIREFLGVAFPPTFSRVRFTSGRSQNAHEPVLPPCLQPCVPSRTVLPCSCARATTI